MNFNEQERRIYSLCVNHGVEYCKHRFSYGDEEFGKVLARIGIKKAGEFWAIPALPETIAIGSRNVEVVKTEAPSAQIPVGPTSLREATYTCGGQTHTKFERVKPHVNVGTIGHIGHGKTTLTSAITKH